MARCPYNKLDDIAKALDKIRQLPLIKEVKPGIFYLKNRGFLHFHVNKEDLRWADVHDGKSWGEVEIPFNPSSKILTQFFLIVETRHTEILEK